MRMVLLFLLGVAAMTNSAQAGSPFEDEILAFEAADLATPPPSNAVLFVGSSTIRLWPDLQGDFPGVALLNRGFGGASFADLLHYMDRMVIPYHPRKIVLYCGDNDIAFGRSPGQVISSFKEFMARVRAALPDTPIVFLAIKPSPQRWKMVNSMRPVNAKVRALAEQDPLLDYVDVFTPMLGRDGLPDPKLYTKDGLHMNAAGYAIWKNILQPHVR